jgi:hypothetical protein
MIQPACARRLITHFGFLGRWRFDRENPRFWGLEKLEFPWILSSESRLINGLRWISLEKNSCRLFAQTAAVEREISRARSCGGAELFTNEA